MTSSATIDPSKVTWGADGLIAAVVQDAADGRVLMLGWQDAEALAATLATGEVHFHSRSRERLWRKGETSGNVLRVVDAALDCDADAILLSVDPTGPTCHTGTRSCFDEHLGDTGADTAGGVGGGEPGHIAPLSAPQGLAWLETLWATIVSRAEERPEGSYTATLLSGGVDAVARKVAEESIEVVLAAKDDAASQDAAAAADGAAGGTTSGGATSGGTAARDQTALAGEVGDLLYHTLVLLAERGLPPSVVIGVLRARHAAPTRATGTAPPD